MLSGFSVNGIFQIQGKLTVMSLSVLLRETHCPVQKVGLNSCMQRKHIGEEAEMKSLCKKVGLNSCMQRKHTGEEAEMKNLCMYVYVTSLGALGKTFT